MTRKPTALADLDIESEALTYQDGLAERLARRRAGSSVDMATNVPPDRSQPQTGTPIPPGDHNAWRRGKSLVQVAIPEETHIELSIIAKRRRMTLSQLVKAALNDWLSTHGHQLRIPDRG